MANLSREEVDRIAALCKLSIPEDRKDDFVRELSHILAYVEKLQEVDTENVPPTHQVTEQTDVFRNDTVQSINEETVSALLDVAPEREGRGVKVPHVFS